MAFNWTLPLRGVQMLFAFLVLVLCGVAISKFGSGNGSLGFLLFCGIWGILSLVYLLVAPSALADFHNVYIILALEFLNMIFFFAGFIAVAAGIGNLNCEAIGGFALSGELKTGCQTTKAATAFGAFSWVLWLITLILVVRQVYLERQGHVSRDGGTPAIGKDNTNIQMSNPNV